MRELFEVLNAMQATGLIGRYAIGGAVGAAFYLEPFSTQDVDIFVKLESAPSSALVTLSPIYDYLTALGYKTEGEYVVIAGWPMKLLPAGSPLEEEALQSAAPTELEGVRTWVLTAEHLAAIALQTGRAKDYARILAFVDSGVLDAAQLESILTRHGLVQRWEQFEKRFLGDGP